MKIKINKEMYDEDKEKAMSKMIPTIVVECVLEYIK